MMAKKEEYWDLLCFLEAVIVLAASKNKGRLPYKLPAFHNALFELYRQKKFRSLFGRPDLIWQPRTGFRYADEIEQALFNLHYVNLINLDDLADEIAITDRLSKIVNEQVRPLLDANSWKMLEQLADNLLEELLATDQGD